MLTGFEKAALVLILSTVISLVAILVYSLGPLGLVFVPAVVGLILLLLESL